jgi:hypothetical protein
MKNALKISTNLLTTFLVLAVFIFCSFEKTMAQSLDFSGSWKVNVIESHQDTGKILWPKQISVRQNLKEIIIGRLLSNINGPDINSVDSLNFDGTPLHRLLPNNDGRDITKTAKVNWSDDNLSLVILSYYDVDDRGNKWRYTTSETWTISDKGNRLNILKVTVLPDHKETLHLVCDKIAN